jgi:hypothetical protein
MGKRVVLIVCGAVLFVISAAVAVGGGALMAFFGSDSTAASGPERVGTDGVALVAAMNDIQDTDGLATVVGRATLGVAAHGPDGAVFVGIGPARAVERYLAGAPIDRVTDLNVDPFRLTTLPRDGSAVPDAPGAQNFWTAQDNGTDADINWKINDGSYRLVVMNADATPNVTADVNASLTVPHLFWIGLGLLVGGVVFAVAGIVLIVAGARTPTRRGMVPA